MSLHRLVALHFIPNPENKPTVNHKIADKSINHVGNLEWATYKEQSQHVRKHRLNPTTKMCCKVLDGVIVEVFNSLNECAEILNLDISGVRLCCIGKVNNLHGNIIRYYIIDTNTYIQTRFDRNEVKSKGRYRRKIFCKYNGKTYNTQTECSNDLGLIQRKVSEILRGVSNSNKYGIEYLQIK